MICKSKVRSLGYMKSVNKVYKYCTNAQIADIIQHSKNSIIKYITPKIMSSAQLTHDIYRYLSQYQILPNTLKYKSNGNFEIQQKTQQQLQCGYLISKLLISIANEKNVNNINMNLLNSIKNSNTPASRVYNWNILAQGFVKLGVSVAKERQKEITSGDWNSLSKTAKKPEQQPQAPPQTSLDIKKLHSYAELSKSETVLQYIIILISKILNLTPKQAIATLAQSGKYLAHMVVKGIKGSFDEIVMLVDEMENKMGQIMYLVEKDAEKNMEFLLTVFKPMLISRDSDVAKAGTKLFKKLTYESLKYNSKNILYQILTKQSQGFDFIYMGLKRHPYLNAQFSWSLYPFLQNNIKDFIQIQLKKTINNEGEYLRTTILVLEPWLKDSNLKSVKEEIYKSGLIQFWEKGLDGGSTGSSKIKGKDVGASEEVRGLYLELLELVWIGYYGKLQNTYSQQLLMKITQQLKRSTRSEQYTIRIPSLLKLFNLLQFLAQNKNKQAALLYKKLIFLYIQNHHDEQLRKLILQNMSKTISRFPTIPLQFLLQPMLKQLNSKDGTTYILNMFDLQFIIQVCKHPKLEEFYAIGFLGYFINVYAKSVVYSGLVIRIIESITSRFCQSQQIREFCLKTTQTSLNNYSMLLSQKLRPQKHTKSMSKQQQIITNQKKSQIIELIKHFISLQHKELTAEIKEKVSTLFVDWYENRNHYDKGLAALLMDIGDIEEILVEYKERKMKEKEERGEKAPTRKTDNGEPSIQRFKNNQSKQLLRYQQSSERGTPQPHQIGLGYKKKKLDPTNKYELLASRNKNTQPDPKVLSDIERIKQKWRLDQSRAKLEQQQQKRDKIGKINQLQLFQRNLSLGYSKLPQINNQQILFQFDSVKKKHLKDMQEFIVLDMEEDREGISYQNVIHRYAKYVKSLFINYASKANFMSDSREMNILSFTEVMRLLKDKNLIAKIPKITINQIITTINQKYRKQRNVLGGIYEQDFPTFILYLTDLLLQYEPLNKRDQPIGLKVQKTILRLLQGQKNVKQLFDPKIQKLRQQLQYNQNVQIPQEFKKFKEVQVQLEYNIRQGQESWVQSSYLDCFQILDGIFYQAVGLHIISPITQLNDKYNIARIYKAPANKLQSQSVDKKLQRSGTQSGQNSNIILKKDPLADSHNSFTKPLKKLSKNVIKKKSQSQRNVGNEAKQTQVQAQRDKKREIHAQKLKQQILKLRQQKQKIQAQKKQKQKIEEQKKQKKEQLRKQYLQQNKKKVLQKKEEDERKTKQQQALQQQNKEKRKAEVKAKQMQMLEKQRKLIQAKRQKLAERNKEIQIKQKQKDKFMKSKSNQKLLSQMKVSAADQRMKDLLVKNSMENGEIKKLIDKNKKNFEQLFEVFWNWQKQKMQLKNLAQMLKDLETTKYIPPKDIADVYKSVAKGQFLGLQNFIQCIVKLSYKSSAIDEQTRNEGGQLEGDGENKLKIAPFQFMLNLLHMNEANYKQTIVRIKNEKQIK